MHRTPAASAHARLGRVARQLSASPVHGAAYPGGAGLAPQVDVSRAASIGSLKGKTVFISGGSRGIGLAIIERCARDGANVVIAAKTTEAHPRLPGTIHTAAARVRELGGQALAVKTDIRSEEQVQAAVDAAVRAFGGIDICINNASAISLTPTEQTAMKRFDLMHQVNMRGTFLVSKCCAPHLKKSSNGHILNISPPLSMEERWFAPHTAYSMAKFGMSMCVLGMAGEFRDDGVAVNALWPRTTIATAAVNNLLGGEDMMRSSRTAEIMADAAHVVLTRRSSEFSGQFAIDETVLRQVGVTDFAKYAVVPGTPDDQLTPDFFV